MLKKKKWYSSKIKPIWKNNLIVMTDMGYLFEAKFIENEWLISTVENYKVYFKRSEYPECIIKWMKV